jgi:hypothetical protein
MGQPDARHCQSEFYAGPVFHIQRDVREHRLFGQTSYFAGGGFTYAFNR